MGVEKTIMVRLRIWRTGAVSALHALLLQYLLLRATTSGIYFELILLDPFLMLSIEINPPYMFFTRIKEYGRHQCIK